MYTTCEGVPDSFSGQDLERFLVDSRQRVSEHPTRDLRWENGTHTPGDDLGVGLDLFRVESDDLEPVEAGRATECDVALAWRDRKSVV